MMDNNGASSTIIARHDYLPFGEEISYSTGLRTPGQFYGATDTNRRKYGLTERDETTGLDAYLVAQVRQLRWPHDDYRSGWRQHGPR